MPAKFFNIAFIKQYPRAKYVLCEKERNSSERRDISQCQFDIYLNYFCDSPECKRFTAPVTLIFSL